MTRRIPGGKAPERSGADTAASVRALARLAAVKLSQTLIARDVPVMKADAMAAAAGRVSPKVVARWRRRVERQVGSDPLEVLRDRPRSGRPRKESRTARGSQTD